MTLEELQEWILSTGGLQAELSALSRLSAARSIGIQRLARGLEAYEPDWQRLLLAASILTKSNSQQNTDAALMVAHAGILLSKTSDTVDASATLLTQLANGRAIRLAEEREVLRPGVDERLGMLEKMLFVRRELTQAVFVARGETIQTNRFQRQFWDELDRADWVSASAPTASGKTYLVLRWLLNSFLSQERKLAIFIAPTRALVAEIERQILDLAAPLQIPGLRVASLPLSSLGDHSNPTILIFTQERLHIFLNSLAFPQRIDAVIVDEVHKLGDSLRGVILQDA